MKMIKRALAALCITLAMSSTVYADWTDVYTVQPGDTLWIISHKYLVPLDDVIKANPQLSDPDDILPGEKVYVPLKGDPPKRKGGKNWNYNWNRYPDNQQQPSAPSVPSTPGGEVTDANSFEMMVIELVNIERAKQGLPPLSYAADVGSVARTKSNDMISSNYFSHQSPTYGSPFDMLKRFGVSYKTAGENIAKGQKTPEAVVNAWMNSEGHRKNILNASFKEIGVGYATDAKGTAYWTQIFIAR